MYSYTDKHTQTHSSYYNMYFQSERMISPWSNFQNSIKDPCCESRKYEGGGRGGTGVLGPCSQPDAEPVYALTHWPAATDVKITVGLATKRDD